MSREEYVRYLIETRYAEDEKEWDRTDENSTVQLNGRSTLLELAAKKEAKE